MPRRRNPWDAEPYYQLGLVLFGGERRRNRRRRTFEKAIEVNPRHAGAQVAAGRTDGHRQQRQEDRSRRQRSTRRRCWHCYPDRPRRFERPGDRGICDWGRLKARKRYLERALRKVAGPPEVVGGAGAGENGASTMLGALRRHSCRLPPNCRNRRTPEIYLGEFYLAHRQSAGGGAAVPPGAGHGSEKREPPHESWRDAGKGRADRSG